MNLKNKNTPFCPKCGKKESVEIIAVYLDFWKCESCKIQFDFSELGQTRFKILDPSQIMLQSTILNPIRILGPSIILDPSKKVQNPFEQDISKIHKKIDKNLLKSNKLMSKSSRLKIKGMGKKDI
jgi:hypothetical protein